MCVYLCLISIYDKYIVKEMSNNVSSDTTMNNTEDPVENTEPVNREFASTVEVETVEDTESVNSENNTKDVEQLCVNDDIEPIEFDYQDDTVVNKPEKDGTFKYTKIDTLDEDKVIPSQRFYCISFISPEGIMNCKTRGIKVRSVHSTFEEADKVAKKFRDQDKYFDVGVAEIGKWCPWDPTPEQTKKTKYKGKDQNEIMRKIQEKELGDLNEVVGRHKNQVDTGKKTHKNRVARSMKDNLNSFNEDQTNQAGNEEKEEKESARNRGRKPVNSNRQKDRELAMNRLRKRKEQKDRQGAEKMEEGIDDQKKKIEEESKRIREKELAVAEIKKQSSAVNDKVAKMKKQLEEKRKQK